MSKSLLLTDDWDLVSNSSGNIATASDVYSMAQDVATACRLFLGELWYNNQAGIPYFQNVLGNHPKRSLLKEYLKNAALTVPGVVDAVVYIDSLENRKLVGRIRFTDATGKSNNVVL